MEKIASGTYGTVYVQGNCAIKQSVYNTTDCYSFAACWREILIVMLKFNHPNVIKFQKIGVGDGFAQVYMQRYDYTFGEWLTKNKFRSAKKIACGHRLLTQVAHGLAHIHSAGIIHGDLKPENILIKNNTAVICDFGISVFVECKKRPRLIQTEGYRAPEVGTKKYGIEIDCWSLGIILGELELGVPPEYVPLHSDQSQLVYDLTIKNPIYRKTALNAYHELCGQTNMRFAPSLATNIPTDIVITKHTKFKFEDCEEAIPFANTLFQLSGSKPHVMLCVCLTLEAFYKRTSLIHEISADRIKKVLPYCDVCQATKLDS